MCLKSRQVNLMKMAMLLIYMRIFCETKANYDDCVIWDCVFVVRSAQDLPQRRP